MTDPRVVVPISRDVIVTATPETARERNSQRIIETREAQVRDGLAQYQRIAGELDLARIEKAELEVRLIAARSEIDHLNTRLTRALSAEVGALAERDSAIAERAVLEALFAQIQSTLEIAKLPARLLNRRLRIPRLVKEMKDEA